jgi:hypothetical protein
LFACSLLFSETLLPIRDSETTSDLAEK